MMDKDEFTRFLTVYRHYSDKKVESIEMNVSSEDLEGGEVYITDIQLQEGSQITGSIPNTKEILKNQKFMIDENHNAVSGRENIYLGDNPQKFTNMKHRFFNVMGRGFETIAIPNVYHGDFTIPILTTGLDLTLYAKDDYDFLRVATFYGDYVQDEYERTYKDESLLDNPLNKHYTREFCFSGGKAGDKIEINASKQIARKNGILVPLGIQNFNVGQEISYDGVNNVYYKNRQRFMALPVGATRINIEFMKKEKVDDLIYMVDGGIGFHGVAEFTQWTWGVSKI